VSGALLSADHRTPRARPPDRPPSSGGRDRPRPAVYLGPLLTALLIWVYAPLAFTVVLSLLNWNLISPQVSWQGAANYTDLFAQSDFIQAAVNTLWYALAVLPLATVVPCALAIALWKRPGRRSEIYRALLFLPVVLAPVANALAWQFILDPLQGAANHLVGLIGIGPQDWLGNPATALPTIVVVTGGKIVALNVLLFGAALAPLDRRMVEAAQLDGARRWEITRWVILPQLWRTIALLAMLSLVVVWPWLFTNIAVLTQGGPDGATSNLYYQLYTYAFTFYDEGTAAATAVVIIAGLGVLLGVFTLVMRRTHAAR
jgi:multiple sugar transport system permease protein